MTGLNRVLVGLAVAFFSISAAQADSVEILDWSTNKVEATKDGTYLAQATVSFAAALSSRDQAFLSIYIEQYPNTICSGQSHTTVGGESWIPISRGRTRRTVRLVYRPSALRVHLAPGANLWPYKGANIDTPGFREFGTAQHLCKSFHQITNALDEGGSAEPPPTRVRPAPPPPPTRHSPPRPTDQPPAPVRVRPAPPPPPSRYGTPPDAERPSVRVRPAPPPPPARHGPPRPTGQPPAPARVRPAPPPPPSRHGAPPDAERPSVRVRPAPPPDSRPHAAPPPAAHHGAQPPARRPAQCNVSGIVVADKFSIEYQDSLHGPAKRARLDRIFLIDPQSSSGRPRTSMLETVNNKSRRFEFLNLEAGRRYELQLPAGWHFQSGQPTSVRCAQPGSTHRMPALNVRFGVD